MATCNKCGLPITWLRVGSKWHPKSATGDDHFDECKTARRKGGKVELKSYGTITGAEYVEESCSCAPWTGCEMCNTFISYHA